MAMPAAAGIERQGRRGDERSGAVGRGKAMRPRCDGMQTLTACSAVKTTVTPCCFREVQMTHPNEDLVRQANAAVGSGELGALQGQYLAEGVVWHVQGRGPLAGDYRGIA